MASHHPIRKQVSPEPTVIPDKLYFRIGDVAQLCGVPAYVLRFWETEFPQLKPNKGGTGQRLYRKRDVEMALRIKSLLYDEGYTIPGARQVFKSEALAKESPNPTTLPTAAPEPSQPAATLSAASLSAAPLSALQPAEPTLDIGAAIRQDARHRDHLTHLRAELRSLAELLGSPTAPDYITPTTAPLKPLRPRLILEPKSVSNPAPKPELKPRLIDQGDLFPSE